MSEKEIMCMVELKEGEKVKVFQDSLGVTCDRSLTEFVNSGEQVVSRIKPTIMVEDGRLMTHYIVVYTD